MPFVPWVSCSSTVTVSTQCVGGKLERLKLKIKILKISIKKIKYEKFNLKLVLNQYINLKNQKKQRSEFDKYMTLLALYL